MEKEIFKAKDRVFDIVWGWGIVTRTYHNLSVEVKFDSNTYQTFLRDGRYTIDSKPTLSFTEYTLQGFSQKRPIELPKVGELCLVREDESRAWRVREFAGYEGGFYCTIPNHDKTTKVFWNQLKRIKILD